MYAARLRSKEPNSRLGKGSSQAETAALCHRCGMLSHAGPNLENSPNFPPKGLSLK